MAWQSSRIIWDKNKTDSSEPQPVTIYDPTGTIYVAGNYALYSDHSGSVAEDYQLYLCKVEETGSNFVSSDWELQKGVKNWYLIARRQFKKGARVIKSDTNGDTASLRLYKCISSMKQPNVWNPDEWEVVYQDVGVAYEVRDHKDVYYDSGSNSNKWHKMMYYLPPENPDKSDEEIEIFSEDRVYHKDDYVIKVKDNNEVALFKYISNTPRAGWEPTQWSEDVSVEEYEANVPYNKGDWVIRKYIEIYEFVIMEFQAGLRYYNGKYCLHIINPDDINPDIPVFNENVTYSRGDKVSYNRGLWEYNLNIPLSGPWIPAYWDNIGKTFPDWYRERILGGESLYGLYRANTTVCGSWNDNEWDLIIDGEIQIRGRNYNTRGLCIMQFQIGQNYLAGDVVIWTATNDTSEFGLSVAKVDIYNCSPAQAPPNETNWNNITDTLENPDQYHVYKAKDNMTAGYNSHFRRDDWLIVTQKILPDDGLYGVIWEKYGVIGGGGAPFGYAFPTYGSTAYSGNIVYRRGRLSYFLTTAANAKFNAYETYNIHLNSIYTDGGTGFTMLVIFNGIAYGFPVFDVTYFNFIYVKLFDDWKKVEILDYYNGNDIILVQSYNMSNYTKKITLISGGFIALKDVTPYIYDGHTYRHKLYKVTISPEGSFLGSEEITVPDILKYNVYISDLLIHFFKNELVYLSNITYPINSYYINYGDSYKQIYFYSSYILTSSGFTNVNSDTIDYFDYIYEYFSQNNYSVFELEDIKQHAYILLANVNKENVRPEPSVAEFTAAANAMGLTVRTEHVGGDYYRYWIDNCPTKVYCNIVSRYNIYEDGISYNSHYKIIWTAYYYTTDSDMDIATYHLRVISNLRVINSLIGVTDYMLFDEDLDTLITLRALRQSDQHFDTDGVPTNIHPIGRLGYKYYFISYLPDFSDAGFDSYDHRIIYDNKSKANRLYSMDLVSHEIENICPAYDYITLRYINNGYVVVNEHKIKELRLWLYESTARRHYLTYEMADQEGYQIANAYIPFNDQNIFSNSTGSAVSVYNNNLFLSDWIEDTYSYGLFIYLPIVAMNSQITMEATGFFWMSSGNNDRGDFYGGYDYDETSFDLPLVF